jgi:guanylate kinase
VKRLSFVVSAPSGTGKTTIIQNIIGHSDNYEFVISTTTRPRRNDEIDGKNYIFVQENVFKKMIDESAFIEWAFVHQHYYGITKKEIDRIRDSGKTPIFDVDVQGAKSLRKKLADGVFIFIVPPSVEALKERLMNRKTETEEQIAVRLNNALNEMRQYELYDYLVVNEKVEESCDQFNAILVSESCRKERNFNKIRNMVGGDRDHSIK